MNYIAMTVNLQRGLASVPFNKRKVEELDYLYNHVQRASCSVITLQRTNFTVKTITKPVMAHKFNPA